MTDRPHARLAPSSAHRWGPGGCPGSVGMVERHPQEETEAAREGTAAHWVVEQILTGFGAPLVGAYAPNGYPVTAEMLDGAETMVDDVEATRRAASVGAETIVEHRVAAAVTIHPDNYGTPDCYLLDRPRRVAHIWDYKFGHRYVDVWKNWQVVDYAACIAETAGFAHEVDQWVFNFTIVQPRCFHINGPVREWRCSGVELAALFAQLRAAAYEASDPDAPLRTGGHCAHCDAAFDCPALVLAGASAIDLSHFQAPLNASAAQLGLLRSQLDTASDRLKALLGSIDERLLSLARAGEQTPGYTVGHTKPRERWRAGTTREIAAVGDAFGLELRKPELDLVTPKQAEKMGIDRSVINAYAETPPGSAKLVAVEDDRALRVFGQR